MTILSGQTIRRRGLLSPMAKRTKEHGLTYGLGPAGYDLRLDLGKDVFQVRRTGPDGHVTDMVMGRYLQPGRFILAATIEHFDLPSDVVAFVMDKSTMARQGLSLLNTVAEPGWRGFLTLEMVNLSDKVITLIQGQAIAQVMFQLTDEPVEAPYAGKYQDQVAGPVKAIL